MKNLIAVFIMAAALMSSLAKADVLTDFVTNNCIANAQSDAKRCINTAEGTYIKQIRCNNRSGVRADLFAYETAQNCQKIQQNAYTPLFNNQVNFFNTQYHRLRKQPHCLQTYNRAVQTCVLELRELAEWEKTEDPKANYSAGCSNITGIHQTLCYCAEYQQNCGVIFKIVEDRRK